MNCNALASWGVAECGRRSSRESARSRRAVEFHELQSALAPVDYPSPRPRVRVSGCAPRGTRRILPILEAVTRRALAPVACERMPRMMREEATTVQAHRPAEPRADPARCRISGLADVPSFLLRLRVMTSQGQRGRLRQPTGRPGPAPWVLSWAAILRTWRAVSSRDIFSA